MVRSHYRAGAAVGAHKAVNDSKSRQANRRSGMVRSHYSVAAAVGAHKAVNDSKSRQVSVEVQPWGIVTRKPRFLIPTYAPWIVPKK
ncbi:hypothetical protein TNCV_367091 [Trichonephila clavipes]|nr:hypothetical protein TNCV_367091 [Trichonephila clavipes]